MTKKIKNRIAGILLATLATLGVVYYGPLLLFAYQIAAADRVVATFQYQLNSVPVSVTLTGEEAKKLVKSVSSARRDLHSYACVFGVRVTFYRGDDVRGEILSCGRLFLLNYNERQAKEYNALSEWFAVNARQYCDCTGALQSLIDKVYSVPGKE